MVKFWLWKLSEMFYVCLIMNTVRMLFVWKEELSLCVAMHPLHNHSGNSSIFILLHKQDLLFCDRTEFHFWILSIINRTKVVNEVDLSLNSTYFLFKLQLIINPRKAVDNVDLSLNNPLSQADEVSDMDIHTQVLLGAELFYSFHVWWCGLCFVAVVFLQVCMV